MVDGEKYPRACPRHMVGGNFTRDRCEDCGGVLADSLRREAEDAVEAKRNEPTLAKDRFDEIALALYEKSTVKAGGTWVNKASVVKAIAAQLRDAVSHTITVEQLEAMARQFHRDNCGSHTSEGVVAFAKQIASEVQAANVKVMLRAREEHGERLDEELEACAALVDELAADPSLLAVDCAAAIRARRAGGSNG